MAISMGIGPIGGDTITYKKKFQWTFTASTPYGVVPSSYAKVAARPNLDVEEIEINHLNAKTWIPGKGAWQEMQVTYYDVVSQELAPLYTWIASVYNYMDPQRLWGGGQRRDYEAQCQLSLYNSCGDIIETWVLNHAWPKAADFGEMDSGTSELCEIQLTLRYSDVEFIPGCGISVAKPRCSPCAAA